MVFMSDKYQATWVSHTSLSDYLKCPRSYYLKNVYKDPHTGHKVQITSPALSLGSAVHSVIESLSVIPTDERFQISLVNKFDEVWEKYTGRKGGFVDLEQEFEHKERGKAMLRRIMDNPGPLARPAVKINQDLPHYYLSESENIILCGKLDWLEYLSETDSVHIIDFKTSKREEESGSLQLPIYLLLVQNCQKRPVSRLSYWYLTLSDTPTEQSIPDTAQATQDILKIARQIKMARSVNKFSCPSGDSGCIHCTPHQRILDGEGELVGVNDYNQDIYMLQKASQVVEDSTDSIIL
jgi:CRISPR/Cas system-associated exonuclease Cas4 (RecB family)